MIVVANAWCKLMRNRNDLVLSAYADNWAWIFAQPEGHTTALQTTLALTEVVGLKLDWSKTWFWCSHSYQSDAVGAQLSVVPRGNLSSKTNQHPTLDTHSNTLAAL